MTFFPGQVQMYGGTPPGDDWPQITPDDSSDPFSGYWDSVTAWAIGTDTVKHVVWQYTATYVGPPLYYTTTIDIGVFTYTYDKERVLTQTRFNKIVSGATSWESLWIFGKTDFGFYCVRRRITGGGVLEMVTWDNDDNFIGIDTFQSAAYGVAFACPNGHFVTTRSSDYGRQVFKATPTNAEYVREVINDPADDYSFPIYQGPSAAPGGLIPWVSSRQEGDDLVMRVRCVDLSAGAGFAGASVAINFGNYDNTYSNDIFTVATAKDGYYLLYERPTELPGAVMTGVDNFYADYRDICARKITIDSSGVSWAGGEQVMGLNLYGTSKIVGVGGAAIFEAVYSGSDGSDAGFGYYGAGGGGFSGIYAGEVYDTENMWQLWAACSIPPLRQKQRNDSLGFTTGSPRLNTPGRGSATSIQETRAPRLPEGGQTYS